MNSLRCLSNLKALFVRALAGTISTILQMYAFTLASVVVVTSIKRTSSLWGILWGRLFFSEDKVRERFIGAVITFVGMLFLVMG
jgi:drug/metabolite transporter (DMT)-like permease